MEAPVCFLMDSMFRIPAKLDALLVSHGHMLPRGAVDELPLIKQDLEKMVAILQEHNESGADDHAMLVKCLTKEVRELSYDVEDTVDQYEHATDARRGILLPRRKKYKITRRRSKATTRLREKLKWRLWMANKIREFSVRSQEALQRYNLVNQLSGSNGISITAASTRCDTSFCSWHPTPYLEPVGLDEHVNKLEDWLGKDGEQKLKVVSVVGSGGIGKTTLAKELYRRIGGQFECRAFVRTSQKPDVRRLLISMLSQVRPHPPPHTWKVHNLIADIRTHLQDKRYLIVIDDVWATQTWDIVSCALPDSNLRSGMLITTGIEDVALKCCGYQSKYVLAMKPLVDDDSSKLFFNTSFGPQHECPPELSQVSSNIIKKCAGLPLATVIAASLVSRMGKPEQWDYVNKSLGYGLRTDPTSVGMKQLLNLSYSNLPQHLKACMMYLSIYQEDYIIQKDDLVQQWIAEGLIRATGDKDKEEISRSYFDELISSRMIQPVHINGNDDVLSCTVHSMVLDFVTHKSIEENFVTAIDDCQTTARFSDKVRRLSLHFGNAEAATPTNMRLSQLRTLAFFGVFRCLPSIVEFGLLRVLILHLWGDDESIIFDLTRISELFRLRYLHIICNVTLEVQQTQIHGLHYLETLKIDARMSVVPSEIVHLPGLLHLSLPVKTNLPNGIGHMASLCTLGYFDLSANSVENVRSLGELTNLRDLRLTCSTVPSYYLKSKMDSMGSIIVNLSNLRCLTLKPSSILDEIGPSITSILCDGWSSVLNAPVSLQIFEWLPHICTFSSLPKWIGHLNNLCILKIGVTELAGCDVVVLRGLPALTVLSLYVRTKPAERIIFNKAGFSVLKYIKFTCSVPWVEFETDAMPNLRKLKLGFDAHGTLPVGIEHLSGLKKISAKIGGAGADDPGRTAAELALSYAIKMHPARPTFSIQHVDWMFNGRDDYNSGLEVEEHITQQKLYEIVEEGSNEQHQVLQKDSREGANKNVHGSSSRLMQSPIAICPCPAMTAGDIMKLSITAGQAAGCAIDASVAGMQMSSPRNSSAIKHRTQSGTFRDGDLLVNKDGLRIVSQSEEGEATQIEPLDNHQLSIDDLDVIKVIGKGSSGNVQLVQHKWTGQFIALKVIQLNIQENMRKQIAQELKISLSTQCQYVVTCYQCFYVNGVISIALEYMDGGSLADFLKTVRTVPEDYLAAICKQVLKGLMYLHHEKRIIHRDLKPSNILINHRGEVKISDFGVCAIIATSSGQQDTFIGTYNYMAPERISGQKYGYISDIWSLGLVILECATGSFPYPPRDSFYELLEAVVEQPPPSAPSDQYSSEFCSFISACIQKNATDRSSAQVLLAHPFLSMYDDLNIDLADYFTTAGSPLATFKQIAL